MLKHFVIILVSLFLFTSCVTEPELVKTSKELPNTKSVMLPKPIKPELIIQAGHLGKVNTVAFSPNKKYIVSGGEDSTLKLWDVSNGYLLRTLIGHSSSVHAVNFSPNGRQIISGSSDNTLKLWDAASGSLLFIFKGHSDDIYAVAFSPNGRQVVSGGRDKTLKLWDIANGDLLRTFTGSSNFGENELEYSIDLEGHSEAVYVIAFSPNGRQVVSGGRDKTLKLWDIASGIVLHTLYGHSRSITSVTFSPNGQKIVSGDSSGILKIWDVTNGNEVNSVEGHSGSISSLDFAPNGWQIVSGSSDKTLKIWDSTSNRVLKVLEKNSENVESDTYEFFYAVTFSSNGGKVISISNAWERWKSHSDRHKLMAKLWSATSTRQLNARIFESSNHYRIGTPTLSSDGQKISLINKKNTLKVLSLWDLNKGNLLNTFYEFEHKFRALNSHIRYSPAVAFSLDGRYIASGGTNKVLKIWELSSGQLLHTWSNQPYHFDGDLSSILSITFSPDGKYIVLGSYGYEDDQLKLWDIANRQPLRTFKDVGVGDINSIAFSANGQQIISTHNAYSYGNTLKLWNAFTGRRQRILKGHSNNINTVAFSPNGKLAISGSSDKTLKLWDTVRQHLIRTFIGHFSSVNVVAFSPNGRQIVSGSSDKTLKLWDVHNGRLLRTLVGHLEAVKAVAYALNGQYIVSASSRSVRLWDSKSGAELIRVMWFQDGSGIAITPEGYFVASNGGEKHLRVTVGLHSQPIDNYRMRFARSDLVTAKLRGKTTLFAHSTKAKQLAQPIIDPKKITTKPQKVKSQPRNNNCLNTQPVNPTQQFSLPNLWLLAIGISQYDDTDLLDLDYAAADAKAIVEAFKCQEQRIFKQVNSKILSDGSKIKPTYENIINNFSWLKQASNRDVVMLFIAGHGTNDAKGKYYLLPRDAEWQHNGKFSPAKAVSWWHFQDTLEQLPEKRIILADTCYAETFVQYKTRNVPQVSALAKALQNMRPFLFTATRDNELSQERDEWGHGAFTYAILQALSGKGDLVKDGIITMKELDTYVSETVPKLTNGEQHPVSFTPQGGVDFPLAVVK